MSELSIVFDVVIWVVASDRLQMGEVVSTIPSWYPLSLLYLSLCGFVVCVGAKRCVCDLVSDAAIGFNVETVQYNNIKFQVWDLGTPVSFILLDNFPS